MIKRSPNSAAWVVTISLVATVVPLFYLLPSVILVVGGGRHLLFDKHFCTIESPDRRQKIDVYRRVDFPVSEIVDPSGVVTVNLTCFDGAERSTSFSIDEYSDVTTPAVSWKQESATVTFSYDGRDSQFELSYSE